VPDKKPFEDEPPLIISSSVPVSDKQKKLEEEYYSAWVRKKLSK
jgi:hypothetical protein